MGGHLRWGTADPADFRRRRTLCKRSCQPSVVSRQEERALSGRRDTEGTAEPCTIRCRAEAWRTQSKWGALHSLTASS
jgi:hypothetical protein